MRASCETCHRWTNAKRSKGLSGTRRRVAAWRVGIDRESRASAAKGVSSQRGKASSANRMKSCRARSRRGPEMEAPKRGAPKSETGATTIS